MPAGDLLSAVSMSLAGNNFCRIAGPALGAPILAVWGAGWAFAVYAATSALVAVLLLPIRLSSRLDLHADSGAWRRMKDGLRHARERPPALAALVTMSVFSVFVGFSVMSVAFAVAPSWGTALGCAVFVGFCYFSMTTALNTLLQHLADDEKRGRIMSLFVVTWGGLIPVGAIWMGTVADATSAPFVVALGASICLVFALAMLAATARRPQASMEPLR